MQNSTTSAYRLSPTQEQVWAHQKIGDGRCYRLQCALELEGPVEGEGLEQAIGQAVARHEILRTVYVRQPGISSPFQVILNGNAFSWEVVDGGGEELQAEPFRSLDGRPFDLEHGPTLSARLVKIAGRQLLIVALPALSADAPSLVLLAREIARLYSNQTIPQDEIMQFVDVGEWQHELLQSEDTKAGREFWRHYWQATDTSLLTSLALPFEKASVVFSPATVEVGLNSALAAMIEEIAARNRSAVQEFLLACWQVLVSRVTGQADVIVAVASNGRRHSELENTLGMLTRHLPARAHLEPDQAFIEAVANTREALKELSQWQDTFAWDHLPGGRPHGLPFGFEYLDFREEIHASRLRMRVSQFRGFYEPFKVKLTALRFGDGLRLQFDYDRHRYSKDVMERLAAQFQTLLGSAARNPQKPVSDLEWLTAAERQRVVVEWNRSERSYPASDTVVSLFEAQVERTPERVAVVAAGRELSYQALNARANQLAHRLQQAGVGADHPVGLCLDRSVDLLVAVLGILKAGGAYVPLNPENPKPRLEQQLAGVEVLVTESRWLEKLPPFAGKLICLDADAAELDRQPATNPASAARPENLVYVIYTSGSTGVPKGVEIEHRNLANYARSLGERLALENYPQGLGFATVSTISADLGNTAIYPALISGGRVHLVSYEEATDAARLGRYMEQHTVDVLKIVPSHLAALVATEDGAKVLPRKYLVTGGEALSQKLLERVVQLNGACEVINHYGPTETTVGSLTLRVKEQEKWDSATIPIGRPLANTRAYILDSKLQPVPVGVVGELYIGGAGVGRGYRKQPQMTGERFVKDPFAAEPNARMYRTGDLARYLENGAVEFLGRADDQVKVRGFRIELGEIEALLAACPGVKQAVVLAREEPETGEKRLLGYVVADRNRLAGAEPLRQHLREQLPDYMVPSALVLLDKLPLNQNGKVDRQALPSPEEAQGADERPYVAPRTPVEEVVAGIWAEVLRLERVGAEDNFFDRGGHSLLATQVVSRLRRELGVEIPLRTIFEAATLQDLAERIDHSRRSEGGLPMPPPITPVSRDGDLPLSFAQQRLWFLDQLQPNNPLYNIPRAIRISGPLDPAALAHGVNELVRRHESQRTVFHSLRGQPVQRILPGLSIPLPVVDLSHVPDGEREAEAKRLLIEQAQLPFDLSSGPLLRATLFKLSGEEHWLLLNSHHIVSDAWSAAVMIEEIGVLYEAFRAHQPASLPPLAIQYADFAVWQRQWLQGEVIDKQLAYWRKALEGAPAVLELPTDRPRPPQRTFEGHYELRSIPSELVRSLQALSRKEGVTLFMTLMAAFQTLLSRYSGQEQIIVGTDFASRNRLETERLIGFFINVLPIRGDLSGDPPFREFLKRIRDGALGAYAHQEMPLDKIVEELQPDRSMSHNPLIQTLFVMQNTPRARRSFADLTFQSLDVGITHSKFDLAVFVVERQEEFLASWLYSTDLFDAATIRRMAGHYENLLGAIVSGPEARLSALEFMSDAEKREREQEVESRKRSQVKKIFNIQPKAIDLTEVHSAGKE